MAPPPVAIVVSRYSETVTDALLQGAIGAYVRAGGSEETLLIIDAPGSFELPALAAAVLKSGRCRAVVALGCIIRGETRHDRVLGHAVTQALANLSVTEAAPVGLGVLTVEDAEQAIARAGGDKGNKGTEAMEAVLMSLSAMDSIRGQGGESHRTARPDKVAQRTRRGKRA